MAYLPHLDPMARVFWPLFLLPLIFGECDIGGTWSTWQLSRNQPSYDYCGSCWKANWIRRCLSKPACPCNGPTEFIGEMNYGICYNPRQSCCPGYMKKMDDVVSYICVNRTTATIETPPIIETSLPDNYCPPSGVGIWGSWSEWGACTASCGQFGTQRRIRNCSSEAYGCPCCSSDVGACQTMPCPANLCPESPECNGTILVIPANEHSVEYCRPAGLEDFPG